jgi:hypothetical protein
MAPIPVWSGNLRLSLVLVPVRLFPATSSEGTIAFRMIHKPSGRDKVVGPDVVLVLRPQAEAGAVGQTTDGRVWVASWGPSAPPAARSARPAYR